MLKENSSNGNINIHEYTNADWTYHAKGAWIYENDGPATGTADQSTTGASAEVPTNSKVPLVGGSDTPVLTIIGSSNFSHRSNRRDTEAQLYIVPDLECGEFRQRLHDECTNLYKNSQQMSINDLKNNE